MRPNPATLDRLRQQFAMRVEQRRQQELPRITRAEAMAAQVGLGRLRGVYARRQRSQRPSAGIAIIVSSSLFGLASLVVLARIAQPGLLLAVLAACAGLVALGVFLIASGRTRHEEVVAGAAGLIREDDRGGPPDVIRWDDLVAIYRMWGQGYDPVAEETWASFCGHRMLRADGTVVELRSGFENVLDPYRAGGRFVRVFMPDAVGETMPNFPLLTDLVEQEVTGRHLPRALAAFDSGQRVDFGPFAIDRNGIEVASELLPWTDVSRIVIGPASLSVHRRGHLFSFWRMVNAREIAKRLPGMPIEVSRQD
jgi:hypothetical protein